MNALNNNTLRDHSGNLLDNAYCMLHNGRLRHARHPASGCATLTQVKHRDATLLRQREHDVATVVYADLYYRIFLTKCQVQKRWH